MGPMIQPVTVAATLVPSEATQTSSIRVRELSEQTEGREKAGRRTEVRQVQYTLYRTRAQMTFTVSLALTGHMNIRPTQMATGSADQKNQ